MAKISARVTKDDASLALNRLTGSGGGGAGRAGLGVVNGRSVADRAAHTMVHEVLPDVFYGNLYNWKKTLRPGTPLLDTATHLVSGFVYSVAGSVATIKNLFRYAHIHDKGATIRAKNVPLLKFKPRGLGWMSKKEVVIPQRRFMYWSRMAITRVVRSVKSMLRAAMRGRA